MKKGVCQNKFWLSFCSFILNAVKDLPLIYAFRRFFACAQNDKMIVALHFDTAPFFIHYSTNFTLAASRGLAAGASSG